MYSIKRLAPVIIGLFISPIATTVQAQDQRTPLDIVKKIGDKLINETPYKYKLTLPKPNTLLNDVHVLDFGRTFQLGKPAVAYAYTTLHVDNDMTFTMYVEHNDGCKIWLNNQQVYSKTGDKKIHLRYEERSIEMETKIQLSLKKGVNHLLIKSETKGNEWKVYMQPPSIKGAIVKQELQYPTIGLKHAQDIDAAVSNISNWIVVGAFDNPTVNGKRKGIDIVYAPEKGIEFGKMYQGKNELVTWSVPKIDVLGDVIDPKEWGTNYNWNYHNGGVAWAMQQLAEVSADKRYNDYATNFCNFHLDGKPFVVHQVNKLNAFNSANSLFINTPLLDFTLAPSLPFIYRLRKETNFKEKENYTQFINGMLNYAAKEQIRLPQANIYTRTTPVKYTTWVDDMFMGIPFLVQASLYAKDAKTKQQFLDDAANQVLGFNKQVFDEDANLYVHAHYSNSSVKLPHWSRANGWGIWAVTEVLMNLPKTDSRYQAILKHYQTHVAALAKLQDPSGFWLNVLDRKDSPKEVSGTAIFTMAIARGIRLGWLNTAEYTPKVLKAFDALKTEIDADGTVHKICVGTMCSEDVNYYINRPFYDNDTHGLFAVLFAGIEVHKMLQKN